MLAHRSPCCRVGADGLKSATRAAFLGERVQWMQAQGRWQEAADIAACIEPVWSGQVAYRALIPAERLRATAPGHQVLTTPMQVCIAGLFRRSCALTNYCTVPRQRRCSYPATAPACLADPRPARSI